MTDLNSSRYRLLPALALLLASLSAQAAECPSDQEAVTASDPTVSTEVLSYRVLPLTVCELEVEAAAWRDLLKQKVTQISEAEVAALYKSEEVAAAKGAEAAVADVVEARQAGESVDKALDEAKEKLKAEAEAELKTAQANIDAVVDAAQKKAQAEGEPIDDVDTSKDAKAEVKTAILRKVSDLNTEKVALIDRFQIVLDEFESKGGDPAEYVAYIKAVSGIKVDVTDASAAWTTFTGWLTSPEGGIRWAVNIIKFLIILLVTLVVSGVAGKAAKRALRDSEKVSTLLRDFLVKIARRGVLLVGLFVALSALEVNVAPVLAVIGAAGFVIAFALQSSLSNFASGILMLLYRPFDIGDFVSVGGVSGSVESMNLLSTQLRTPDNQMMVVPNNSVWGDVITNITGITRRRVDLVFGIGYSDDIDKAQSILEDIVAAQEKVLDDPKPVVKLHELADSSVNFVCRPWVKPSDYWDVYWNITREVKRRFDAEGVSIPFPQTDMHVYHETALIPADK